MRLKHLFAVLTIIIASSCSNGKSENGGNPSEELTVQEIINNPKAVDLGLSVLWADRNVGSDSPSDFGTLTGWGDPTGELTSQNKNDYIAEHDTRVWGDIMGTKCVVGNKPVNISGTANDIATAKWGSDWRMPTKEELRELVEKCTPDYNATENGVKGVRFTAANGNSVFLPYAGMRKGDAKLGQGAYGDYWSATSNEYDSQAGYAIMFDETGAMEADLLCPLGISVRPVKNK